MKKKWLFLIILVIIVMAITIYFLGFKTYAVVSTSATAPMICSTTDTETTCTVSNYLGLGNTGYPNPTISIDGVGIPALSNYFKNKGVAYSKCKISCTGSSGYSGKKFATDNIEGSVGEGCFISKWIYSVTEEEYSNAWSTSCVAVFYNEVANLPEIPCNNDGTCCNYTGCSPLEDITCIDCQGENVIAPPLNVPICVSDWSCGEWSACVNVNNAQTRECKDGCGNTKTEELSCTPTAIIPCCEDDPSAEPCRICYPIIITPICSWNPMTWGGCFSIIGQAFSDFFSFKWLFG